MRTAPKASAAPKAAKGRIVAVPALLKSKWLSASELKAGASQYTRNPSP